MSQSTTLDGRDVAQASVPKQSLAESLPAPLFVGVQRTADGAVLSHTSFPVVTLAGPILAKWDSLASTGDAFGSSVQDVLGAPLGGAAHYTEAGKLGQAQTFERGVIAVRPDGGCCVVYGEIYARYLQLGGITGTLGWPKSDETGTANGGRFSDFDGGTLFWSATSGAKLVRHAILAKYDSLGTAASYLGLPISDEEPLIVRGTTLGYFSLFAGGGIWWTNSLGAHDLPSYVLDYWRQHGGATGIFGLPTSELWNISGTTLAEFERGLVVFTPSETLPFFDLDVYVGQFESNFDDIHVEVDVAVTNPNQHEHFWIPSSGYASNPVADHHVNIGLLRLATEVTVTATGYGDHTLGHDERLGTFKGVYNARNVWGIPAQQTQTSALHPATENANPSFHFNTTVAIKTRGLFNSPDPRRSLWWPFHNFDTPFLSQHQMAQTFTDVSEDETNFWHPFDNLFYKYVYQRSGESGTCFGMCLEAIYARVDRSVFAEPVFDNPLIAYPPGLAGGDALDAPTEKPADTARFKEPCQIKFGYQLGHSMIDFAMGKFLSGGTYDPVTAFRESRDAYTKGDFPILSLTSGGLGSPGHAIMPYRWDDSSKPWRIWVANPNAPASTIPDDNDSHNVLFIDPDTNSFHFVVGNDKLGNPELWQGGRDGPGMLFSVPFHILSSEPATPFWDVVAALAAATLVLLIFAGDDDATTQIADGHGATAFRPPNSRARASGAKVAWELKTDPAGRPNVAPVMLFNPPPAGARTELYRIGSPVPFRKATDRTAATDLPAATLAYTHTVAATGAYQWAVKPPGGSTVVSLTGGSGSDTIQVEQIGRPGQSVSIRSEAGRKAQITVCGARQDAASARLFTLSDIDLGPTHTVTTHLESAGEHLIVQNSGAETSIGLHLQSGLAGGQAISKTVILPATSIVRIRPETWATEEMAKTAAIVETLDRVGGTVTKTARY